MIIFYGFLMLLMAVSLGRLVWYTVIVPALAKLHHNH